MKQYLIVTVFLFLFPPFANLLLASSYLSGEKHWRIIRGNENQVILSDNAVSLYPGIDKEVSLWYRNSPLRDKQDRPAFGPFSASLQIEKLPAGTTLTFSVVTPDGKSHWGIECIAGGRIRVIPDILAPTEQAESEVRQDGNVETKLKWHWNGKILKAGVESGGKLIPLGEYTGDLPSSVNLAITATTKGELESPVVVGPPQLVFPTPDIAKHTIMPRPGRDLPADDMLRNSLSFTRAAKTGNIPWSPERLSGDSALPGGDYLGGFLWTKQDDPTLGVLLKNLTESSQTFTLKSAIRDVSNHVKHELTQQISIGGKENSIVNLVLPKDKYGFFTVETKLYNASGELLDTPLFTDYAITAAIPPQDLPDSSTLGVHANAFANLGAKWLRFWDNGSPLLWTYLEPKKDEWQWKAADAFIDRTLAVGMKPVVVLAATPEWASSDTSYTNYLGRGSYSPPINLEDWTRYCRQVAQRYRGKIDYFEIWNEPNFNGLADKGYFFYGTAEAYFSLLKAAYEAIKEVNPDAKVLAPSGTGNFQPFLERILALGGAKYFDILSLHTYTTPLSPDSGYEKRIKSAKKTMDAAGTKKPIWNTEVGYYDAPTHAGLRLSQQDIADEADPAIWPNWWVDWPFRPVDQRRSAAFRVSFLLLGSALGVEKTFFHHRLIHNPDGEPYISAPALAWANRILLGAKFDQAFSWHPQCRALGFHLPDERYMVAVWRTEVESLEMKGESSIAAQPIDMAPLAGAVPNEAGLKADATQKRRVSTEGRSYFDPKRTIPKQIGFDVAFEGFDFFGNALEAARNWRLEEAPKYIIMLKKPDSEFKVEVEEGRYSESGLYVDDDPAPGGWSSSNGKNNKTSSH